jgi:hypothetical protein
MIAPSELTYPTYEDAVQPHKKRMECSHSGARLLRWEYEAHGYKLKRISCKGLNANTERQLATGADGGQDRGRERLADRSLRTYLYLPPSSEIRDF